MAEASRVRYSLALRILTVTALVATMLAIAPAGARASENVRVDMKALIIAAKSSDGDLAAWKAILDRAGMPYDVFITTVEPPITDDLLSGGVDHARYQTVIMAAGDLLDCSGTCIPTFSTEEWATLDTYQARFGIRRVSGNVFPNPQRGLNAPTFSGDLSGQRANLTTEGLANFPSLAGPVDMGIGVYGHLATPASGANFTTFLTGPSSSSMMGVYVRPDGIEELVMTMAMGEFSLHTLVLGHGILSWATRGAYLGYERSYFTFDIDDIFLPDDRWDAVNNTTHEDDCATLPCIRMVPSDVTRASSWSATNGVDLTMVFNGLGSQDAIETNNGPDPLTDAFVSSRYDFRWTNHQWSHEEFDFITQKRMIEEIQFNTNWAKSNGIPLDPRELVTGSHSGLHKAETAGAVKSTGVKWLGSDNSREPDPFAVGDATTLPRHPSNVFYNVGTFAEQLDEYNYIYFENCTNTPTTTCLTEAADWATYVDNEASIMLRHVLGNDPRPHYFHQANLAEEGTFYPVVDEVIRRYNLYVATPLVQPNSRIASDLIRRGDEWGPAKDQVDAYIQLGNIYLTSATAIDTPMTGLAEGQLYGGERSMWLQLDQNTTRIVDLGGLVWPDSVPSVTVTAHQDLTRMVNYGGYLHRQPASGAEPQ
jgi:hypothetical protein